MKRYELAKHGIKFIEGQSNLYCKRTQTHQRSYLCIVMKISVFESMKKLFPNYGVHYVSQSNSAWDMRGMKERVWVTKVRGVGTTCIELLDDEITLDNDDVYVVMWNDKFLPRFIKKARFFDMDILLIDMLEGKTKPPSWILRVIDSIIFKK